MDSGYPTLRTAPWQNLASTGLSLALAVAVILPPKYMAVYVMVWGVGAALYALLLQRHKLANRQFLLIFGCLSIAAVFCFLGTFPIRQKSDINLEFAKYAVYTAAFLSGYVALGAVQAKNRFAGGVMAIVVLLFLIISAKGGPLFQVDQSWPIYPPDQNNSVIILITLAVGVIASISVYARMFMLFVLAVFVAFVESRLGLVIVIAAILLQARTSIKLTLVVLAASIAVWAYMSSGSINPQTKMIFATQSIIQTIANTIRPDPQTSPAGGATNTGCADASCSTQGPGPSIEKPPVASAAPPAARLPANRPLMEVGTESDLSRVRIYQRVIELSASVFPNLIGMGDSAVVERLNTPPIARHVTFQHAHNFLLQSYLAYGMIATLAFVAAALSMLALAIRYRNWSFLASLVLVIGFGMIEALTSDIRVLTIICLFLGSNIATLLAHTPPRRTGPVGETSEN